MAFSGDLLPGFPSLVNYFNGVEAAVQNRRGEEAGA
jgi:hypothetical protein